MASIVRSLAVAAAAAGLLSACATYDGYGYSRPYYGYDYGPSGYYDYGRYGYGYSPYYYDYGPGYYYGAPAIGFDFSYRDRDRGNWGDRDRRDWRDRNSGDGRRYDGDRRTSRNATGQGRTAQQRTTRATPTNRSSGTTPSVRGQRIAPAPVARSDAPRRNASGVRQRADVRAEQRE